MVVDNVEVLVTGTILVTGFVPLPYGAVGGTAISVGNEVVIMVELVVLG